MFVDFSNSCSEVGSYEEFPTLDFGLDYDEAKVRFWVHVASHLLHEFDLLLDSIGGALDEAVFWPAGREIVSNVYSAKLGEGKSKAYGKSSAAPRSLTQARVKA